MPKYDIPEDVQRGFDVHQVIDLLAADDPVGAVRIIAQYCGRHGQFALDIAAAAVNSSTTDLLGGRADLSGSRRRPAVVKIKSGGPLAQAAASFSRFTGARRGQRPRPWRLDAGFVEVSSYYHSRREPGH